MESRSGIRNLMNRIRSGPSANGVGAIPANDQDTLAAVDLGSNSFHMIVARFSHGQLTIVDRLREMVRLAAGLDEKSGLDPDAQSRALDCLGRFGQRVREIPGGRVRVVGTNALRKARRANKFLEEAESLLGHPIQVISGIEEARLIYLGASHSLPAVGGPQLCVDIGGGSTEIVRGEGNEPQVMESLYMGCVSISERCFGNGKLTARRFDKARTAVRLELEPVKNRFLQTPVSRCAGTSGTIRAASSVLGNGTGERPDITREGLGELIDTLIAAGRVDNLDLPGLSAQRRPVFAGGIAILVEVMDALNIERMAFADGALREGIIYDLVGRLTDEDARVRSVRAMAGRFQVDSRQAEQVEALAAKLFAQVAESWQLAGGQYQQILSWAALLHEIGLDIAHAHYHRHGAYLLENADLPGFPNDEQLMLARLVATHRRSFSRKSFSGLPRRLTKPAMRLAVLLRLAVLFNRSRAAAPEPVVSLSARGSKLQLQMDGAWLEANPLTVADLEREQAHLASAGFELHVEG